MRSAAFKFRLAAALCLRSVSAAACSEAAPCVDAEPLWHSPSAGRFVSISDTNVPRLYQLAGAAVLGFRLKPAVLVVPSPSAQGREVNLISHATDLSLGARMGIGSGMEITLALPAGLYQRGAGIKGVTHQSAPGIPAQSLHDPRLGFGVGTGDRGTLGLKLRLELKLPIGDRESLMGEAGPVLGSTAVVWWRLGRFFVGGEGGVRLRSPIEFFGRRIGTQGTAALGLGYALPRPQLAFALETYVVRSEVARDGASDNPAEWLASVRFTPQAWPRITFGVAGGTGLPGNDDGTSGVGTPLVRALAFARWAPAD